MARAGWCGGCGGYVYLTADGACPVGHGAELISQEYDAPEPGVAVAIDQPGQEATEADASAEQATAVASHAISEEPAENVASIIAEAARLADERVTVERVGESFIVQSDSMSADEIVGILDRALALAPDDIDLLLAKSDMLALGMQFKSAEDVLDEILAREPDNFEALTRKEQWGEWSNVFTLPRWSEHEVELPAPMSQDLARARSVQVVRSGVKAALAVVRPVQPGEMAAGLGPQTRVMWEPVWSPTSVGAIVAHYLVVEDNPADPYRAEAFLPLARSEKAARMNGYWLLRQLAHADGCFVVLAEGDRVVYNRWYPFPSSVKAHLTAMEARLVSGAGVSESGSFNEAMQWHMNNFDMNQVQMGRPLSDAAAGVAGFEMPTAEPTPATEPEPTPAPVPAPAPLVPGVDLAQQVLGDLESLLGDASLTPPLRALVLLNLCQVAEAIAPERVDGYWSQLAQVKSALAGEHAQTYKELAEELGEPSAKADSGFAGALIAQVNAARTRAATDRDGAIRELAAVEQQLGERKMPFGKKRVYGALADAWLDLDRGQAIRLFEHSSGAANRGRIMRMNASAPLTQDEWRMLSTVLKPAAAASLAAVVLRAQDSRVDLPAELVEATGRALLTGVVVMTEPALPPLERLDPHERLVASLSETGRFDEAWTQVEHLLTWATTAVDTVFGNWVTRFSVIGRAITEAVMYRCVSEERFAARVDETPVAYQAYARAFWRAKTAPAGSVAAGFDRLVWEMSPATLQRPMGYRVKHGGDPAKLADAGHRDAAYTLYFMLVATGGLGQEALDVTAQRGLNAAHDAVARALLSSGNEVALALLPPEQFAENSIERFLALGTAEKRAEHLVTVTGNGAHSIPGCLWRDTDAAQAMPQVHVGGMFSKETAPRHESSVEYCQHNPIYRTFSAQMALDQQFSEWVRLQSEYDSEVLDAALMPALVAWSDRDWQPARNAMVWMWEAMKPTDEILMVDVLRNSVIKRACRVLAADPEVLGTYVLPWLQEELVKKGRQWTQGNTQITLRLTDANLAALCIDGAIALADLAPARRDRVVEIALAHATGAASDVVRAFAQVYMIGREPRLVSPPVPLSQALGTFWGEGVVTSIVNEVRKRLLLAAITASLTGQAVS